MPDETRKSPSLTLEEVAQQAQETTLRFGNHIATLITEGSLSSAITQFKHFAETHEGRKTQMFLRGLLLAQSGELGILKQAFFISEAWISPASQDDVPFVPPSHDPKRKEVLLVARHVIQPPKRDGMTFVMKRNSKARLIQLETLDIDKEDERPEYKSSLMEAFIVGFLGVISSPDDKIM